MATSAPQRPATPRLADVSRRLLARSTGRVRRGPDFLIIGTQRGGTTSLYHYLAQHPAVVPSARKEVHYFDLQYHRGDAWYRSHFPLRDPFHRPGLVSGEASPYYLFHPLVPARVAASHPGVRLIVLLRDPVDRAISHHEHERAKGRESLPLAEALEAEPDRIDAGVRQRVQAGIEEPAHRRFSYVARGRYAEQLERWFAHFPRDRFLILRSESLFTDPARTVDEVTTFLGLRPHPPADLTARNVRSYPAVPSDLRRALRARFVEDTARLNDLLGDQAPSWT